MAKPPFAFASSSRFIASIEFDHRLAPFDLEASAAHVEMLGRRRIISRADSARLRGGLKKLSALVAKGRRLPPGEDIHVAIEQALHASLGPVAGKAHTARSRNDQVVTAFRLYLRRHADVVREKLRALARAFISQAEKNLGAVMPGFTHLQPGQPILVSHHLLAYGWMVERDLQRLKDLRVRLNRLPLGAAALAGTSFPIDREWVARRLGFEGVIENSIDAVSDRDFAIEFLSFASIAMMHLSRLAEELVLWSNPAWGFVTLQDEFVSGSSIMPQKRNPDVAELIRGKCGRVYGDLVALLTLLKAQPLAYNRDLQEDKPPVFDAVELLEDALDVAAPMVAGMAIHRENTLRACGQGDLLATDVADALVRRGLPFREAHEAVASVARYARNQGIPLAEVPLAVWQGASPLLGGWVRGVLSVEASVASRRSQGGTAPDAVRRQMALLKRALKP